MSLFQYLPVLKNIFTQAQKSNKENPEVKTAPKEVYERVQKKVEEVDFNNASATDQGALIEMLRKKLEEAQRENEAHPDEETADTRVFDDLNRRMQEVFDGQQYDAAAGRVSRGSSSTPVSTNPDRYSTPPQQQTDYDHSIPSSNKPMPGTSALVSSGGGSLALRLSPDMGAGQLQVRVPHQAQIYILETTQTNAVHLDGKVSGWVKVDFNGVKGWILDRYITG